MGYYVINNKLHEKAKPSGSNQFQNSGKLHYWKIRAQLPLDCRSCYCHHTDWNTMENRHLKSFPDLVCFCNWVCSMQYTFLDWLLPFFAWYQIYTQLYQTDHNINIAHIGLILCQGHVPEKHRPNQTKFLFKILYFLGIRGLKTSPYIAYDYTSSRHTDLYSTYVLYIQYTFISIHLFLIKLKCKRLTSIVFGMVHSDGSVLSLATRTLCSEIALSINLSTISRIVRTLLSASLTLWHMSTIRSPFSSRLIVCNFSSIWIVFRRFSTWIALGDVDIRFSLMFGKKANCCRRGNLMSRMIISLT